MCNASNKIKTMWQVINETINKKQRKEKQNIFCKYNMFCFSFKELKQNGVDLLDLIRDYIRPV